MTDLQSGHTVPCRRRPRRWSTRLRNPTGPRQVGGDRPQAGRGVLRHVARTATSRRQVHADTEGGAIKPDLVVQTVPGGGQIVVDSKLPLDAYLSALESEVDSERDGSPGSARRRM